MSLTHEAKLYIGGEWITPEGGLCEPVLNPATEEVIAYAGMAAPRDADRALAAARDAFDNGPWPHMSMAERAAKVTMMCDWIEARSDGLRAIVAAETGSNQVFARTMQFAVGLEHARHYIEMALRQVPQSLPLEPVTMASGNVMLGGAVAVREPVGVCLAITPFNVPFTLNLGKAVPALLMGNTVILKPSPMTPLSAMILAEAADASGVPPGVLNVVNGGSAIGQAMTTDPRVELVTFTGSDRVGAEIQLQAAPTLKRCVMELGGKSAMIVRADGDLTAAARAALNSLTSHAGQACAAMTRLVVHNSVRAEFVALLSNMFKAVKIGDPADSSTQMGPLIRAAARDRVATLAESGIADGARLVTGGRIPNGFDRGFFFEPTLLDDVDNGWRVAREEAFGPLGVVIGFDTDEEAVAIANDSDFGLSGAVYSANVGLAYELAGRLRTGKVNLNGGSGKMSSYHPFGGIKRSGYGREFGEVGLHEFTYVKTIAFHVG